MNYLDILPNDVMKIINRKVQDAQIIKRRIERKENKRIQREKNKIAGIVGREAHPPRTLFGVALVFLGF